MFAGSGTLAKPDPNTAKRSNLHHQVGFTMLAGAGNGDDDANSDTEFERYCDAALGIEEAFEDDADTLTCRFCRKEFDYCDEGCCGAGKHLVEQHNFGGCNLFLPYHSKTQFRAHSVGYHSMNVSDHLLNSQLSTAAPYKSLSSWYGKRSSNPRRGG